jgi:hypothetical protein
MARLMTRKKVLDTRYFFACPPSLKATTWPCPVLVVAVAGAVGDWAAYIGGMGYGAADEEKEKGVYQHGAKLTEEQARGFFPGIDLVYRP